MYKVLVLTVTALGALASPTAAQACTAAETQCYRPGPNNSPEPFCASTASLVFGTFSGICYVVLDFSPVLEGVAAADWAQYRCEQVIGGNAASIHSPAENAFISNLRPAGESGTVYIGGRCPPASSPCSPGEWTWTDRTSWDYENWRGTREPSGDGNCVQFWPDSNGSLSGWNDVPCTAAINHHVVCKYSQPEQPLLNPNTWYGDECTIRQRSSGRYLDAYQTEDEGYAVVTRPAQGNDTQIWVLATFAWGSRSEQPSMALKQKSSGRYLDAYQSDSGGRDYAALTTRDQQDDRSHGWYYQYSQHGYTLRQVSRVFDSVGFLDAYQSDSKDYRAVTRSPQEDDTQLWLFDCAAR